VGLGEGIFIDYKALKGRKMSTAGEARWLRYGWIGISPAGA